MFYYSCSDKLLYFHQKFFDCLIHLHDHNIHILNDIFLRLCKDTLYNSPVPFRFSAVISSLLLLLLALELSFQRILANPSGERME